METVQIIGNNGSWLVGGEKHSKGKWKSGVREVEVDEELTRRKKWLSGIVECEREMKKKDKMYWNEPKWN